MSEIIIDADSRFPVNLPTQHIAIPDGYRRCDICNQLVLLSTYDDHLSLHVEIIEDLRRKKK